MKSGCSPISSPPFLIVQFIIREGTITSYREEYGLVGIGKLVVEMPSCVPFAINIEISRIGYLPGCPTEAVECARWWNFETNRTGIVDGLDNRSVVIALCWLVRPEINIDPRAPAVVYP